MASGDREIIHGDKRHMFSNVGEFYDGVKSIQWLNSQSEAQKLLICCTVSLRQALIFVIYILSTLGPADTFRL